MSVKRPSPKREVLFVQGGGEGTHDEWDDKLVASLRQHLGRSFEIAYPRMPDEHEPSLERWKPAIEKELEALGEGAVLVGHSIGGTLLLSVLAGAAKLPRPGAIVCLAAPFVGDGGWPSDELRLPPDLGVRLPQGVAVHFFHGLDDDTAPPAHVELYARAVPQAHVHRLAGRDHQLNDDLSDVAAVIRDWKASPAGEMQADGDEG
jgi:predicted alpha/beta hydrolase family esterase